MTEPIFPPRRTRIRDDLRRFLRDARLSRRKFALILNAEFGITTNESAISRFLDPHASATNDEVVLAIETYLNRHVRPEWEKDDEPGEPALPPATLFEVARAFFRMGHHKVRQYHRSVPGTYRFYAYSEGDRGRAAVCLGAIRFDEDFSAEEIQTSVEESGNTIREGFHGHYIYRGDSLIAMLRNKKGREPKFYILAIPSYDTVDGKRESITGLLLKTGEHRPVFGTTIHMIRNDTAFEGTDVISREDVDPAIRRILDNGQWLPK